MRILSGIGAVIGRLAKHGSDSTLRGPLGSTGTWMMLQHHRGYRTRYLERYAPGIVRETVAIRSSHSWIAGANRSSGGTCKGSGGKKQQAGTECFCSFFMGYSRPFRLFRPSSPAGCGTRLAVLFLCSDSASVSCPAARNPRLAGQTVHGPSYRVILSRTS